MVVVVVPVEALEVVVEVVSKDILSYGGHFSFFVEYTVFSVF